MRRHTQFSLKILEIDFVIEILLYLTFWPLPRAPGSGDQKNCPVACAIDVSNSHTKSGWISENFFGPSNPPRYPQVRPVGHDPGDRIKIPSDMFYIFHLWEDSQSLVKKSLKLTLFICLFVALRPKSTAMVIAGRSVHLTTLFPRQAWTSS